MNNNYKWCIVFNAETQMYVVTGYHPTDIPTMYHRDGASVSWANLDAALEHIRKHNVELIQFAKG